MRLRTEMAGQSFGRWRVLSFIEARQGKAWWLCRCNCGTERAVCGETLRNGNSLSCGCLQKERAAEACRKFPRKRCESLKHGEARCGKKTREYRIWKGLRNRCNNHNNKNYIDYGGRGITACERWDDYANFLADMGRCPSPAHSIDRIDNERGYEPGNCRWATKSEQSQNRRHSESLAVGANLGLQS